MTFLVNIYRPVFYLKHDISETGFCFRRQVAHLSKFDLKMETESSARNVMF
jgi:hypothetical protein